MPDRRTPPARASRVLARGVLVSSVLTWAALSRDAEAQAASWIYLGGGATVLDEAEGDSKGTVHVDAGLGTSAEQPLVLGGMFRFQTYYGSGTDVGLVARLVTRGFVRGGFGAGVDAGVQQRWWGQESTGAMANLVLGAPWGITLIAGGSITANEQLGYFASAGIDFARLTVHRHSGLNWFENPMPSPPE